MHILKKFLSVRKVLTLGLVLSTILASYLAYYKITNWGFSFKPKDTKKIWTIESHINFKPTGENIRVSLAIPQDSRYYKVLDDIVNAPHYKVSRASGEDNRIILTSKPQTEEQNLYYKILLFDNEAGTGIIKDTTPKAPRTPNFTPEQENLAKTIIDLAKTYETDEDFPQRVIHVYNEKPIPIAVSSLLPYKVSQENIANSIIDVLAYKSIPSRIVKGVKLEENKKSFSPDIMIEAYVDGEWKLYNIKNGQIGLPNNFVIFQKGDKGLLNVTGGVDSSIQFSVIRSITSNLDLANQRSKLNNTNDYFSKSIYSLPIAAQNTIKWLSIFPLAILMIVIIRNVIGLQTMGTFTPMLIAMSLTQTGLVSGLISFIVIIIIGMFLRTVLSKLNLLLVPRISSVVIFVILIMEMMTIIGYREKLDFGQSSVFFPLIIMAWIIERASITWEEDGAVNATREIIFTVITSLLTYFVIQNQFIRHIMFAFNEFNLVILFIVMLLGTYTGYRLLELKRFAPLVK